MRLVTWNMAGHKPDSPHAIEAMARIAELAPDIVCLTDAHEGSTAPLGGYRASDIGAVWGADAASARKVVIWSRTPLEEIERDDALSRLGGLVSGLTQTPLGTVRLIGVCLPHHMAWRPEPGSDEAPSSRPAPWTLHVSYLERLQEVLAAMRAGPPSVIAGAFNQFLPLVWGSWAAHHALKAALGPFGVVTSGDLAPMREPTVNHVAIDLDLRADAVMGIDRMSADGEALTDHAGAAVDLVAGGIQIID
ncbi:hypothetical protein GC169_03260 [bacterium]|nr:hypothetical protein [bacterium]